MVVSLFLVGTQGLPRAVRLRTGCGAFLTNRRRKAWLFYSKSNPRRFQRLLRVLRHVSAEIKKPPDGGFLISGGDTGTRTLDPMIKSHLLYQLSYVPRTEPEI